MEEDDEFGDLYTDVLSTFPSTTTTSSSLPPPPPPTIDLNLEAHASSPLPPDSNFVPLLDNKPPGSSPLPPSQAVAAAAADFEQEPLIIPGLHNINTNNNNDNGGWGSESDSDSEDDLQIVLNNNHAAVVDPSSMIIRDDDDDDDDGDGLIIVADDAAVPSSTAVPPDDQQDWGDDSSAAAAADPTSDKPGGAPKPAYPFHHSSFHSQYRYVRPGASPSPNAGGGGGGGPLAQVRPPMGMAGRGRGDWRPPGIKGGPPMQKPFWGPNAPPRGLEFTLPSHKTIFEVDIDSFEEKPWKYPGVDLSDFFNFSLSEETWKDYCKQLEQLRVESTMQSKIRVYESGRAEQEYDPDLPPELAAAAGIHDSSAENVDIAKADGLPETAKGSTLARPPLPTGRAIQVETGYGERLPSVDTRQLRARDSDVVIEIVLQDSADNDAIEDSDNDSVKEDDQVDVVDEDGPQDGVDLFDGRPREFAVIKEDADRKRSPPVASPHSDLRDKEEDASSPQRASSDYHLGSEDHTSVENVESPNEERWTKERVRERSPRTSSGESAPDPKSLDYQRESSVESVEQKHSQESSPTPAEDAHEACLEVKAATDDDVPADTESGKGKDIEVAASMGMTKKKHKSHSTKQQRQSSRTEPSADKDVDDKGDYKASRSSDNSKATGSSRDNEKWRDGIDEEVVQNGRSSYMGEVKRRRAEGVHDSRGKDRDGRMDMVRNCIPAKGREEPYSHKDWDPYAGNNFHAKLEVGDRRKDRDYSDVSWQRRDEDLHERRIRSEDGKKQDRGDEMVSRHRVKVRETDRSDKDQYIQSRKLLDNGSWRGYSEKDPGLRYREKDDGLKSRHEILDDHHSKRRKDDEHMRRDHAVKDDILLGHRENSSTRGKRERDGASDHRKRDDQSRVRTKNDDHLVRHKDDVWVQRERVEQQRERDEWYRARQTYEENMSRREREEGRTPIRSSRAVDEKIWVGHSRGREEHKGHLKDGGRHSEQLSRRERVEEDIGLQHRGSEVVYERGNQLVSEGKRPRQERSAVRNDLVLNASNSQKFQEKKHKDSYKKAREPEADISSMPSKRHHGEKGISKDMDVKNANLAGQDTSSHKRTREGKDISSDDEQHDSKRGRSKLERWASHKEKDYGVNPKSSTSLKIKETSKVKNSGSGSGAGASAAVGDESTNNVGVEDDHLSLVACKESGDSEGKDLETKPVDDRHMDTVEKLKRRSERFKLPLASEKDPPAVKKMESEPSPSCQAETPANVEVKQERPPRKRRWISS